MSNTPVYLCGKWPRWVRRLQTEVGRGKHLSDYDAENPFAGRPPRLFDHHGETIIDGRRALVTEPYSRGCIKVFERATDFAYETRMELRVCLPTWHGYGTMRFSWLAPREVKPPKYLVRFVELHAEAAALARKLVAELPAPPATWEVVRDQFWRKLWPSLPRMASSEVDSVRVDVQALLNWHSYARHERLKGNSA